MHSIAFISAQLWLNDNYIETEGAEELAKAFVTNRTLRVVRQHDAAALHRRAWLLLSACWAT